MYETVIVPLDGSDLAEQSVPHATALAQRFGARICLARACDPLSHLMVGAGVGGGYTGSQLVDEAEHLQRQEAEKYLGEMAEKLATSGLNVESCARRGPAVDTLVKLAADYPAPIFVVTTRGRGGFKRFLLGSVTDGFLREAQVPVVVIPSKPS